MLEEGIYKTLRIQSVKREGEGFVTIEFAEGHNIDYQSGQYLTLVQFSGDNEIRRSYSIISSPVLNEPLSIGVKRVENGALSRLLVDAAKAGDEWLTTGAGGFFTLPDQTENYQQLFFFAAGSGITPVYSLLKSALFSRPELSVVLVYSNASADKAIFLSQLQLLQRDFPDRFFLEILFSNAPDLSKARLHRDLIFFFLETFSGKDKLTLFYTCGPEAYMRLCTYTLQEAGVVPSDIKKENFFFHDVAKRDAWPPDKEDHTVTIQFRDREYILPVTYPNSILQTAKKAGVALPYSCEAGRCGNCVARCVAGSIWHSYNEVLTEKELAQGLVLTCVGHPVGGDAVLRIE